MNPISSWSMTAQERLLSEKFIIEKSFQRYNFNFLQTEDSFWCVVKWPQGAQTAFRMAFAPGDQLLLKSKTETEDGLSFYFDAISAGYQIDFKFPDQQQPVFRYTTKLTPRMPTFIPFWPKDILPLTKQGKIQKQGEIHASQTGNRSGVLFLSMAKPHIGSIFYFQNLSALTDYCETTKTSAKELVGGKWPEIGFSLPITTNEALPAGKEFTISDAFILLSEDRPEGCEAVSLQFLNSLASLYPLLPRPEPEYRDWLNIADLSLRDLAYHKGCWTHTGGHPYLNAYVSDYKTPAEIMVQLAVLLPLMEYGDWKQEQHQIVQELIAGLPAFYEDELKTVVRWVPSMEDNLDKSEEQKRERVMDSWYLHHPLMNLARLSQRGNRTAKKLLLDSIGYVIRVAKHFGYEWPVFYRMDTLAVVKAETEPGNGGEKDVPGAYAQLMLEVWKITGEQRYLSEAKNAVKKLNGKGFEIFYQANNTAFSAGALLRLFKETRDENYLRLSYSCLAGIFLNVSLWECNYGFAKHYPTFFSIYPLKDAPYTAAYEELEVYAGLIEFLKEAEGIDLLPSVELLISEFIRYAIGRMPFYYPPMLPEEMFADEVKTGEIDPKLWIPLEDLHDGWEKSGEVGQEVYGAGIAFGVVSRQYFKVPGEDFLLYLDYPVRSFRVMKSRSVSIHVKGDPRLSCRLRILRGTNSKHTHFLLTSNNGNDKKELKPTGKVKEYLEFEVKGNQRLKLEWKEEKRSNIKKIISTAASAR
jgi:hypothetical protein